MGEKIKALRHEKRLNTKQLGEFLNVTDSQISKWERDICEPKISNIKKLCEFFNITMEELWNDNIDI